MLDCVDVGFLPAATLDELPTPSRIGAIRVGGIDLNKPRGRAASPLPPPSLWHPTDSPSPTSRPRFVP
jgi:hypothetical protein